MEKNYTKFYGNCRVIRKTIVLTKQNKNFYLKKAKDTNTKCL